MLVDVRRTDQASLPRHRGLYAIARLRERSRCFRRSIRLGHLLAAKLAREATAVQSLWERLGDDGRRLLAAAVLLIVTLDLPWDTLPPPVVDVAQLLGGRLRDYPTRISDLHGQLTSPGPSGQ